MEDEDEILRTLQEAGLSTDDAAERKKSPARVRAKAHLELNRAIGTLTPLAAGHTPFEVQVLTMGEKHSLITLFSKNPIQPSIKAKLSMSPGEMLNVVVLACRGNTPTRRVLSESTNSQYKIIVQVI